MAGPKLRSAMLPPPVKGWVTNQPISGMDPLAALSLTNVFPERQHIALRKGTRYHSKTIGTGIVYGIGALESGATSKLVATGVSAGTYCLYDATTASAAATILTNDAGVAMTAPCLYYQQFRDYLYATSGQLGDTFQRWSGTGNVFASFTGLNAPGPMTVYKSRMYCLDMLDGGGNPAGTSVWYGGPDLVTGAMTEFPFKSLLRLGGNYGIIATVTRAKDFSEDELFCYISLNGEVLIYQGNFPGDPTWSKIGHYIIPKPLGVRAYFYVGPDLHVMTVAGVVSIQAVMRGEKIGSKYLTISDNIDETIISFWQTYSSNIGSVYNTGIEDPINGMLITSYAKVAGTSTTNYVMNLSSGAWTSFINNNGTVGGYNALCWAKLGSNIYYGTTNSKVFKANTGDWDEDPANEGAVLPIDIDIYPAYNYFNDPMHLKQFVEAVPFVSMDNGLTLTMDAILDYSGDGPINTVSDTTDTAYKLYKPHVGLKGVGKAASLRISQQFTQAQTFKLEATEVFWNEGEVR